MSTSCWVISKPAAGADQIEACIPKPKLRQSPQTSCFDLTYVVTSEYFSVEGSLLQMLLWMLAAAVWFHSRCACQTDSCVPGVIGQARGCMTAYWGEWTEPMLQLDGQQSASG